MIIRRYVTPRHTLSNDIQFPKNLACSAQNPKPPGRPRKAATAIEHGLPAPRPGSGCKFGILDTADHTNASLRAFIVVNGQFELGYIDMPWSMGRKTNAKGAGTISPEKHYPTMNPDACREFCWGEAFNHNAIVGFWVVNGQLDLAMDMLKRQGFKAWTLVIWKKVRSKGGDSCIPAKGAVINMSEILIIARRGKGLPIDHSAKKFPSVMVVERTKHSAKPAIFREALANLYPKDWKGHASRKLELFARVAEPGWKVWGNQAPVKVGGAPVALRV